MSFWTRNREPRMDDYETVDEYMAAMEDYESAETDAIVAGLRALRESALRGIDWNKRALESARINGITDTTYGGDVTRYKYFLRLIDEQLENNIQLKLF